MTIEVSIYYSINGWSRPGLGNPKEKWNIGLSLSNQTLALSYTKIPVSLTEKPSPPLATPWDQGYLSTMNHDTTGLDLLSPLIHDGRFWAGQMERIEGAVFHVISTIIMADIVRRDHPQLAS